MQALLLQEQEENSLLRDITGVQVCILSTNNLLNTFGASSSLTLRVYAQRLEDVTFLDAVVDSDETSLSSLGEVMHRFSVPGLA